MFLLVAVYLNEHRLDREYVARLSATCPSTENELTKVTKESNVCVYSFLLHPREDGLALPQRSTRVRDTMTQQDFRTAINAKTTMQGGMQPVANLFRSEKEKVGNVVEPRPWTCRRRQQRSR